MQQALKCAQQSRSSTAATVDAGVKSPRRGRTDRIFMLYAVLRSWVQSAVNFGGEF